MILMLKIKIVFKVEEKIFLNKSFLKEGRKMEE